jgi:hypothetical protein
VEIQRHQLKGCFTPTFKLVTQLLAAKRDLQLPQALAKLDRFDVVMLEVLIDSFPVPRADPSRWRAKMARSNTAASVSARLIDNPFPT